MPETNRLSSTAPQAPFSTISPTEKPESSGQEIGNESSSSSPSPEMECVGGMCSIPLSPSWLPESSTWHSPAESDSPSITDKDGTPWDPNGPSNGESWMEWFQRGPKIADANRALTEREIREV